MRGAEINTWQAVQTEVLRRIRAHIWRPGDAIPHEEALAEEFGCARATVNRALRQLAEDGLLDRRRKAGTRVTLNPSRKAKLDIPVLRVEIESKGMRYFHEIVSREVAAPPLAARARLQAKPGEEHLHLVALHMGDDAPYVYEDRWINLAAVPKARKVDFTAISANEWLVRNVPFEGGEIAFSAVVATKRDAAILRCAQGDGLMAIDRITRRAGQVVTAVRQTFKPGYQLQAQL
ncbi:MAG: GntR family transcriptional regulator [Tagaea sp. CACIAM 22H2]|nr:GntR family transcriptional regulator [Tagaea sp. CACIAM 22H2]